MEIKVSYTIKRGLSVTALHNSITAESVAVIERVKNSLIATLLEERFGKDAKRIEVLESSVTELIGEVPEVNNVADTTEVKRGRGRPLGSKDTKPRAVYVTRTTKNIYNKSDFPIGIISYAKKKYNALGGRLKHTLISIIPEKYSEDEVVNKLTKDKDYLKLFDEYVQKDYARMSAPTLHLPEGAEPTLENLVVITRLALNIINSERGLPQRDAAHKKYWEDIAAGVITCPTRGKRKYKKHTSDIKAAKELAKLERQQLLAQ